MNRRQFGAVSLSVAIGGVVSPLRPGRAEAGARSGTHVYLLRGFMGLSAGLDVLAEKLRRQGINATVHSFTAASALAASAAGEYKSGRVGRIVLIGHSMGGSAVLSMADQLGQAGVPVALLIPIDPTGTTPVSSNVRRVVNLYISNGMGTPVLRGEKFRGQLQNLEFKGRPDLGHMAIQSSDKVHQQVIGYVLAAN
jgi:pimeloyl-ACP methyl ester carboxylesterase